MVYIPTRRQNTDTHKVKFENLKYFKKCSRSFSLSSIANLKPTLEKEKGKEKKEEEGERRKRMDGGYSMEHSPHVILHFLPNKGQRISDFPHLAPHYSYLVTFTLRS